MWQKFWAWCTSQSKQLDRIEANILSAIKDAKEQIMDTSAANLQAAESAIEKDIGSLGTTISAEIADLQAEIQAILNNAGVSPAVVDAVTAKLNSLDTTVQNMTKTTAAADPGPVLPAPAIASLSPASVQHGSPAQTLTIDGTNFTAACAVSYNGVGHTPTFVSATELTIQLTGLDLAVAGAFPVVVTNPNPASGASAPAIFAVT